MNELARAGAATAAGGLTGGIIAQAMGLKAVGVIGGVCFGTSALPVAIALGALAGLAANGVCAAASKKQPEVVYVITITIPGI